VIDHLLDVVSRHFFVAIIVDATQPFKVGYSLDTFL
jgi:hypothetical protein